MWWRRGFRLAGPPGSRPLYWGAATSRRGSAAYPSRDSDRGRRLADREHLGTAGLGQALVPGGAGRRTGDGPRGSPPGGDWYGPGAERALRAPHPWWHRSLVSPSGGDGAHRRWRVPDAALARRADARRRPLRFQLRRHGHGARAVGPAISQSGPASSRLLAWHGGAAAAAAGLVPRPLRLVGRTDLAADRGGRDLGVAGANRSWAGRSDGRHRLLPGSRPQPAGGAVRQRPADGRVPARRYAGDRRTTLANGRPTPRTGDRHQANGVDRGPTSRCLRRR